MYKFVDRPVNRLTMSGRFLLWATRAWSAAIASGICPPQALLSGFSSVGAVQGLRDFHIGMALLNRDASREIAVAPLNCPRIAEDEAVLLQLWHNLALGDVDAMRATLGLIAPDHLVPPIARAITAVAAQLIAAGFVLDGLIQETFEEDTQ
ncbi:hypothetical protein GRI97_02430 [Altererythrobacter xixiisoli]|uniref:Uncharacterized protein n=1 Tax=Croceibacterium xixiisoli TaxID=1476466 RepID=A0A6I4TPI1_9SPHN|nr:hypothetical protein [Croceibacterium xixiisoli]MXO97844.1 hypothetical protein [Croceibacterium xixiisoli]